jgi:hypothetical protein
MAYIILLSANNKSTDFILIKKGRGFDTIITGFLLRDIKIKEGVSRIFGTLVKPPLRQSGLCAKIAFKAIS